MCMDISTWHKCGGKGRDQCVFNNWEKERYKDGDIRVFFNSQR